MAHGAIERRSDGTLQRTTHDVDDAADPHSTRLSAGFTRADAWWVGVVAADFFLLSNPLVFWGFTFSLLLTIAVTVAAVLVNGAGRLPASWLLVALTAYLGLGWLSRIWSINPGRTLPEILKISLIAGIALVIAASASARVIAIGVTIGASAISIASIIVVALDLPGSKWPPTDPISFAGIGTNGNILAYCLVPGLAMTLAHFPTARRYRILWGGGLAVILLGLYLSDSRTGWVAAGVVVLIAGLMHAGSGNNHRMSRVFRLLTTGALALLLVMTVALPFVLRWLQPDGHLNFGDRLRVWEAAIRVTEERPLLGYGWGAVWPKGWEDPYTAVENTTVLVKIQRQSLVTASHGHNSVYDLLPQVGWLGVALFCALVLTAIFVSRSVNSIPGGRRSENQLVARVAVLGTGAILAIGLTEPIISIPLGLFVFVVTNFAAVDWLAARSREGRPDPRTGSLPPEPPGSTRGTSPGRPDPTAGHGRT